VVTLNGIVSSIDHENPVIVTIVEHGMANAGTICWWQSSFEVQAHPFALLLPELGTRILIEPGEKVRLRAAAIATDWERDPERTEQRRVRTAVLEDGDRAIITGMLTESREVELIANQYRSQKEKVRIEYVLKPYPEVGMRIDSETLVYEIQRLLGPLGWVRGIGTALLVPAYVGALDQSFSTITCIIVGVVLAILLLAIAHYRNIDRRPWFDRPHYASRSVRFCEDTLQREPP
jgi:hypothetical protein